MKRLIWRPPSMPRSETSVRYCRAETPNWRASAPKSASRCYAMHTPDLSTASQHVGPNRMTPHMDPTDYSLAIKNKGRPPKTWRWEIYAAGKRKPVQQSDFFETMGEATRAGKAALAELRANQAA